MKNEKILDIVFAGVGMAMGVAAVVINLLGAATTNTLITLLGIGVFCLGILELNRVA